MGERLFEAGRLLTFSALRMGAYSRWALIRGWALIRINTVCLMSVFCISLSSKTLKKNQFKSKLKRKLFEILEKEDDYIRVSDITGQFSKS